MSAQIAYSIPTRRQEWSTVPPLRKMEIVTTRAQRRARPRTFYAAVTVGSIFALLLVQLLLSIVLSAGAYQISGLQSQQKQLSRVEQALTEKLDLLASPQSLASKAESLGMVVSTTAPVFLRLADGTVVGSTGTATNGSGGALATGSQVPNSLLDAAAAEAPAPGVVATESAPVTAAPVTAAGSLPSPVTR
jgi:hypothetical protein